MEKRKLCIQKRILLNPSQFQVGDWNAIILQQDRLSCGGLLSEGRIHSKSIMQDWSYQVKIFASSPEDADGTP